MTTQEITKGIDSNGKPVFVVATWEWRNGWNLTATRPATTDEITRFEKGNGLPVKL